MAGVRQVKSLIQTKIIVPLQKTKVWDNRCFPPLLSREVKIKACDSSQMYTTKDVHQCRWECRLLEIKLSTSVKIAKR